MPRQKAAESRKIPESGSVIPREGVERLVLGSLLFFITDQFVIPREGVESVTPGTLSDHGYATDVIPREGVESKLLERRRLFVKLLV